MWYELISGMVFGFYVTNKGFRQAINKVIANLFKRYVLRQKEEAKEVTPALTNTLTMRKKEGVILPDSPPDVKGVQITEEQFAEMLKNKALVEKNKKDN